MSLLIGGSKHLFLGNESRCNCVATKPQPFSSDTSLAVFRLCGCLLSRTTLPAGTLILFTSECFTVPPALSSAAPSTSESSSPRCGRPDKTFLLSEVTPPLGPPARCTGLEHRAAVSRRPDFPSREAVCVLVCDKIVKPMH